MLWDYNVRYVHTGSELIFGRFTTKRQFRNFFSRVFSGILEDLYYRAVLTSRPDVDAAVPK
jgi:hypothetical protein